MESVYIHVYSTQAPTIMTPLSDQVVSEGHNVQFQCQIQGDTHPSPNVEWSKDGQRLVINRAFCSVGEKSVQLRIKGTELEDEGEYVCVLSNNSGSVQTSARLTVTGKIEYGCYCCFYCCYCCFLLLLLLLFVVSLFIIFHKTYNSKFPFPSSCRSTEHAGMPNGENIESRVYLPVVDSAQFRRAFSCDSSHRGM